MTFQHEETLKPSVQGGREPIVTRKSSPIRAARVSKRFWLLAGQVRPAFAHACSSSGRFLCLGFLREDLGSISLAAGTVPTRSRAMAFTSLPISNVFFLRGNHPPQRARQHLRGKGLLQEHDASAGGRFQRGHVHRITARDHHAQRRIGRQQSAKRDLPYSDPPMLASRTAPASSPDASFELRPRAVGAVRWR